MKWEITSARIFEDLLKIGVFEGFFTRGKRFRVTVWIDQLVHQELEKHRLRYGRSEEPSVKSSYSLEQTATMAISVAIASTERGDGALGIRFDDTA